MYIPVVSLARRHKGLVSAYWRMPYIHENEYGASESAWMFNDAFVHGDVEMMRPAFGCQYRLEDGPSSDTAIEWWRGRDGTYSAGHERDSGPKMELSAKWGRGHRQRSTNVFTSDHDWTGGLGSTPPKMTGAEPSDPSAPGGTPVVNPTGLTSFPFTISVWAKIVDPTVTHSGGTNDISGDDATKCPMVSITSWKESGGTWGQSTSFRASLELTRFGGDTDDPPGCFRLQAKLHSSADDGSEELVCLSSSGQNHVFPYLLATESWHLISAVFDENLVKLFVDGQVIKVESRASWHESEGHAGSAPDDFVFPTDRHMQVGLNCDLNDGTRKGVPQISYAYLSTYDFALDPRDMTRQYLALSRVLDMKIPWPLRSGAFPHHASRTMDDLKWSSGDGLFLSSQKAKFRHDGRFATLYELNSPKLDLHENDYDWSDLTPALSPKHQQTLTPRAWDIFPPNEADPANPFAEVENHAWNTLVNAQTGGYWFGSAMNQDHFQNGNGVTVITGWVGTVGTDANTIILNHKGQAPDGTLTYANWASCGPVHVDVPSAVDGHDGFCLYRRHNKFVFWTAYETKSSFSNPSLPIYGEAVEMFVDIGDGKLVDYEYQAIGVTVSPDIGKPPMTWCFMPPPNRGGHDEDQILTASGLPDWPAGGALARLPRSQSAWYGTMHYTQHTYYDGSDMGGSGEDDTPTYWPEFKIAADDDPEDTSRYGPIICISDAVDKGDMKRMLRVMHGQRLMRSRPALRGCNRHTAFVAPTRILT